MNPSTGKEIAMSRVLLDKASSMEDTMMKHEQTINIPLGNTEDYLKLVVPLYEASNTGDWETAKIIFDKRPDLVSTDVNNYLGTTLHVAATSEETKLSLNFMKNLVNIMTREQLELKNKHDNTAFSIASSSGKDKMAFIMMEKNRNLLNIRGNNGYLPLSIAAITGTDNIVKCLYKNSQKMTGDHWTDRDRCLTLFHCVERNFFDVAVQIVEDSPELGRNVSLLEVLAQKPYAIFRLKKNLITRIMERACRFFGINVQPVAEVESYGLKLLKIIWAHATRTMNLDEIECMLRGQPNHLDNGTTQQHLSRVLFVAAETGNTGFIVELLRTYPHFMFNRNEDGFTIFHVAVMHRHHGIYSLLYEIGSSKDDICMLLDKSGNNLLHLVGKTSKEMAAKTSTSLLMQRELRWFKEVHYIMPPYLREAKNKDGETPHELFSKENEDTVSKGLKWMKDCIVVAALIVTIAFDAAFTFDAGNFTSLRQPTFLAFVIAGSICLFSSSTSLLVFLSILTSRHKRDFVYSLPRKLMVGLLTLFISVVAMMLTFSVGFFVLYGYNNWLPILIAAFAALSVIVFTVLQFSLLLDMFHSMYEYRYLLKHKKPMLYTKIRG
ncbi:uncharacterized protein LOC143549871 [Bidens hawaiensis]|uniref:uncharacterized protein LOC143549871 n=1 Tax=Bidens hawaiensis TaxID=980011 RepID=UPI00404AD669